MDIINAFKDYKPLSYKAEDLLTYWLHYMDAYPQLKKKSMQAYGDQWETIGLEKVFRYQKEDIKIMYQVADDLVSIIKKVEEKAAKFFSLSQVPVSRWIIYHGLGNQAGGYQSDTDKQLIFGLEKIVELGWQNHKKLSDLVAHEYAHFLHDHLRSNDFSLTRDFHQRWTFNLYIEGLATYAENMMYGRRHAMPVWYERCIKQEASFKGIFLKRLKERDPKIQEMFGDWYPVLDTIESAYFLGMRMIEQWHKHTPLDQIMIADQLSIERQMNRYLKG